MKISYLVQIPAPQTHYVQVTIALVLDSNLDQGRDLTLFLPSWSPGSYLLREYSRHLRALKITDEKGREVEFELIAKGSWLLKLKDTKATTLTCRYEVYCYELTVRTCHIDATHAFLQGPAYLLGLEEYTHLTHEITLEIPPEWSKIATALPCLAQDSTHRFRFKATNYDYLIDSPIELGCHENLGFKIGEVEHLVAIYGYLHEDVDRQKFLSDIQKICQTTCDYMGVIPFKNYVFIIHFIPGIYGGLEHLDSTVLQFDGRKLTNPKDYLQWLCLVSHEYFHAWNVKRLRPIELGPFHYTQENYTRMLWLAEGLTSFMDNYFVLKSKLCSIDDYLDLIKSDLNTYYQIQGRRYDSLEESSFQAWIKLYRPHENSNNVTISYYLKGGLVFFHLYLKMTNAGYSFQQFILALWKSYEENPSVGIRKTQFMSILEFHSNTTITNEFDDYLVTTIEIPFVDTFHLLDLK